MSLPSWPESAAEHSGYGGCAECEAYERSMKEAYAARLRLAVEALQMYRDEFGVSRDVAGQALAAIGEVPQG